MDAAAADFVTAKQHRGQGMTVISGGETDIFQIGSRRCKDDRGLAREAEIIAEPFADRAQHLDIVGARHRLVEPVAPVADQHVECVGRNAADGR